MVLRDRRRGSPAGACCGRSSPVHPLRAAADQPCWRSERKRAGMWSGAGGIQSALTIVESKVESRSFDL